MIKLIEALKKDPDYNVHRELNGPVIWSHYNTSYDTWHRIHRWAIYLNWRPLAFDLGFTFHVSRCGLEIHLNMWVSLFLVINFMKKKDMDPSDEEENG